MPTDDEIDARVKDMAAALQCFTERDVMLLTGMNREPLVRLRNAGKAPPSVLMGRTLLFPIPAFRQWLADNIDNPHPKSRKRQEGQE
jgi:predicted DNA-binding transcriptional regulator AlpA